MREFKMKKWESEKQAREEIKTQIKDYYNQFKKGTKAYEPGDRINYAGRVYNEKEMQLLTDSVLDFWLTSGRFTEEFETRLAQYLDVKYTSVVNSGSSANLLAFLALTAPELGSRQIKRGDEVITVACAFPTTVTPMLQFGAVPVFVDITIPQYNIDVTQLEAALSEKTKAVMIAHSLGNPFDLKTVKDFCNAHKLWLIEDNCDALGAEYLVNGKYKKTGTIGDIGTSSFYPAHHLTMGEGGALYTNNPQLHKIIRGLRDWGRDCVCPSGHDNTCQMRFTKQYGQLPFGYDHKYVYSYFGYNLKATDMQAAIGCAQLDKLPDFVEKRRENWDYLRNALSDTGRKLILPEKCPDSKPSWFGFALTLPENSQITRFDLTDAIEKQNIQTRLVFSGNIIKHPCFDSIRNSSAYKVVGNLLNTDYVMGNTFWIGVYPGMTNTMLDRMAEVIKENL